MDKNETIKDSNYCIYRLTGCQYIDFRLRQGISVQGKSTRVLILNSANVTVDVRKDYPYVVEEDQGEFHRPKARHS